MHEQLIPCPTVPVVLAPLVFAVGKFSPCEPMFSIYPAPSDNKFKVRDRGKIDLAMKRTNESLMLVVQGSNKQKKWNARGIYL